MLYQIGREALLPELKNLGLNPGGLELLAAKKEIIPFKVSGVRSPGANILKQEMLAAGGDCAVPAGCVACSVPRVDILLLGTVKQYHILLRKLTLMPYFGLVQVKQELETALKPQAKQTVLADGRVLTYDHTLVMGIINVTPDSFYAPSRTVQDQVLPRAEKMLAEGADILDIGGASTRPGTALVSQEEEQKRVVPAITALRKRFPQSIMSVDTYWSKTAAAALAAGADIINDVSAMEMDPDMAALTVKTQAPIILMHMRGTPRDMQQQCAYHNVVQEVLAYLYRRAAILTEQGLGADKIILDPGIGFAKTPEQNLELLRDLEAFSSGVYPALLGASRKSTIGLVLGGIPTEERLAGTLALTARAAEAGTEIVRVHDVLANVQVLKMLLAVKRGKV